jgi:uncharacterized protein
MQQTRFHQTFNTSTLPENLTWLNEPAHWQTGPAGLVIHPDAKTDFWQRTHYGFRADSGHFLYTETEGDFVLTTHVKFSPLHQYDQAGLMVRLSPDCWLKTSVEFEPDGPSKLGVVVTNSGYSDWSTQSFPFGQWEVSLRIRREKNDYLVEYLDNQPTTFLPENWVQLRMAHLLEDDGVQPVRCGLYACSPIAAGYRAEFRYLKMESQ